MDREEYYRDVVPLARQVLSNQLAGAPYWKSDLRPAIEREFPAIDSDQREKIVTILQSPDLLPQIKRVW